MSKIWIERASAFAALQPLTQEPVRYDESRPDPRVERGRVRAAVHPNPNGKRQGSAARLEISAPPSS